MSANPTRVDWEMTNAPASQLEEGNRVLESIAHQEAIRALLAFSDLHEQIRSRRLATGLDSDRDLFDTERFILDEVLQLICDRAQAVTQADGIVIALVDDSVAKTEIPQLVCRASAGSLTVGRGVKLIGESEFLQDCLDSGRILRCDDCDIDTRAELDFSRIIAARSTVLVPLRGRHQQFGVLQAFSKTPWAFTDHDIQCLDLFSELVLSALKPEDQDRRIHWLSDVAGEVLKARPMLVEPNVPAPVTAEALPTAVEAAGVEAKPIEIREIEPAVEPESPERQVVESPAIELVSDPVTPEQLVLIPATISATMVELPEPIVTESEQGTLANSSDEDAIENVLALEDEAPISHVKKPRILPFPKRIHLPKSSRPGLSLVASVVAAVALFSACAWWGIQLRGKTRANHLVGDKVETLPTSVTAPAAPARTVVEPTLADQLADQTTDHLMDPEKVNSNPAPLVAVPSNKLSALPKVTGVRHWSSTMGSTVVIDMEDNVPYEVHRLMSPERIYFDLHDTVLNRELDGKTMDVGDTSLTRVRIAQPVAGVTRVVLDTKDGSNFSVSMESSPYRLVVELHNTDKTLATNRPAASQNNPVKITPPVAAATAPLKAPPVVPLTSTNVSDQPLPVKTGRFRIVLDAGHGGWDLGTVGRQGLLEKDLVLDVTQRLGKLLQARLGSDVVLTRSSDSYLPLDQRADLANQAQADLFVSVHANYSSSASARGVETYYTNLFSAPGSREVEKHDDGTFSKITPVSLSSGALHEKIAESQRLAASVQRSLYATLAANSPDIRNRGIKDSAFVVLTGTTMPSILTEISFVSSPADERNLQSAAYRQQIAEALYQGIARYQQSSPRTKVAQLQTSARR